VALLALRQRQSKGSVEFFESQQLEEAHVTSLLDSPNSEKEAKAQDSST
jgi:hypothetical protein